MDDKDTPREIKDKISKTLPHKDYLVSNNEKSCWYLTSLHLIYWEFIPVVSYQLIDLPPIDSWTQTYTHLVPLNFNQLYLATNEGSVILMNTLEKTFETCFQSSHKDNILLIKCDKERLILGFPKQIAILQMATHEVIWQKDFDKTLKEITFFKNTFIIINQNDHLLKLSLNNFYKL